MSSYAVCISVDLAHYRPPTPGKNEDVPMNNTGQKSLTNPASPIFGVLSTAVMGVLPLIDASKLDNTRRQAAHIATAVVTGAYVAVTVGGNKRGLVPLKAVAGLAAAGIAMRFADTGDAIDARLEQKLRLAGARSPRRWMAVGAAAITFAGFLGDRVAARRELFEPVSFDQLERVRPVEPAVRRLVEGVLGAAEIAGAGELRAQLDAAQEAYWYDGFTSTAQFMVPDELPRAVPHNQVFPVRARFAGPNGNPLQILLQVFDGKIDHLAVDAADPEHLEDVQDMLDGWPDPSEVTYVLDGPDGKTVPVGQ